MQYQRFVAGHVIFVAVGESVGAQCWVVEAGASPVNL